MDFGNGTIAMLSPGLTDVYVKVGSGNGLPIRVLDRRSGGISSVAAMPESVPQSLRQPLFDLGVLVEAKAPEAEVNAAGAKLQKAIEALNAQPAKPKAKQVDSSWAEGLAKDVGGTVVPVTDDLALIRGFSALNGQSVYSAAKRGVGRTRVDVDNYSGKDITPAELATLVEAKAKEVAKDRKAFAKNPDGPFKGAKTNVVKSDTVDQRYADYLQSLMATLGMGDVRLFLVHPEDMSGAQDKYGLHGDYYSAMSAGLDANEQGSARLYGPSRKDFYISVKSGMAPAKTVEVLAHELGHVIEKVAFKNAPKETQAAIKAEFNKWLEANKGKTAREWIDALRNRETAESTDVPSDMDAAKLSNYWRSFDEWFADNVSRWATTAKKPVGVVEKFFADLAKQFRALVNAVTGKSFAPNTEVAKFLDAMGPSSAEAWMSADTPTGNTPQAFKVSYSLDKIVDSSELMKDEPGVIKQAGKQLVEAFTTAEGVAFGDRFRTLVADTGASVETKMNLLFDGAVRTAKGVLNPMGLYRQAQDTSKLLLTWFEDGSLIKNLITGTYETAVKAGVPSMKEVLTDVQTWAKSKNIPFDRGMAQFSKMLEALRLDALRKSNAAGETKFSINKLSFKDSRTPDQQIDVALAEYAANPELALIKAKMDKMRFDLIDKMVAVGRLTPEEGKAWKEATDYVPFDRIEDFATTFRSEKSTAGGIAQLGKLPKLVTTKEREVGDVLNNFTKTAGWMLNQIVQQDATLTTLRMMEDMGYARLLKRHEVDSAAPEKTVPTYIKGEPAVFELPSRWDVLAFRDMSKPKGMLVDLFAGPSNILRKTITSMPPFAVRQVVNDIQRAFVTSGVQNPYAIILPSLRNFVTISVAELMGQRHPSVKQFGKMGVTGDFDINTRNPMDSIMYDLGFKARGPLKELLHRLDGVTRASDLAVRKAIYDQTMKETQDALLAQTRAREFINFRRRGASDVMATMTATIPFFNAYIQGMDVLYRAATGKGASASVGKAQARRLFASKVATMAAFSAIYAIMMSGDDEYEEADLRTRNNNWLLPGGFKLPVPEELAAIYKVPVEMALEYFRRNGTPEDMEAAEASITALKYAFEQYLGRTVPVPAAVKPVLEAITNHSFFTGEQLEGTFQQELVSSQRVRSNTSELAKAIAEFTSSTFGEGATISPIKIDNFLQGYFGSVSGMLTMATDQMINPDRIDRPMNKYWMLSNFLYDPVGTRRVNEFYELREKVVPKLNTLRELAKYDPDRAEEYMKVHEQDLVLAQSINTALAQLSDTRGYKNFLNSKASADMSMEERKAQLEDVRRMEVELVGWLREARASLRNQ